MSVDFLDTNVFVYLFDRQDERRRVIAEDVVRRAHEEGSGIISWQVVQETLHVITRKAQPALDADEGQAVLDRVLVPLWQVFPSAALYGRALRLRERFKFGFYDSLIVAAALEAGCGRLLTEDLQHGQRIDGLHVENPFRV